MRLTSVPISLVFSGLLFACGAQPKRSNSAAIEDAQARLVAGDWADAAQRFDKLANQHNRADLFLAAAQAYCHLGQNGVCEARLAAAARLAPTDKRVLLAISRAIKFEAPKTQLQDSKGTPNAASFWSQRAREKVQKSNISSALSDLEVATGIDEKKAPRLGFARPPGTQNEPLRSCESVPLSSISTPRSGAISVTSEGFCIEAENAYQRARFDLIHQRP